MIRHQLSSHLLVALAVLLVESAVSAQEAKAPPKQPPTSTQRQQPAQPKAPAKTTDGKAEKAPVVPTIFPEIKVKEDKEEFQLQRELLLSELSNLDANVIGLSSTLARAVVKAEIADAVWGMDKRWAGQLLKEAFELALPDKETRQKLKELKKGSNPIEPTREMLAQEQVRRKILAVAKRDAAFFEELVKLGKEQMGEAEEVKSHSSSAYEALQAGDKKQAIESINKLFDTDPTQVSVGGAIREMAIRDRAEADKLVIGYIQALWNFPVSSDNVHRVVSSLRSSVFPAPPFDKQGRKIPVAGEEAQRAYYGFLIECLLGVEQREPGTAMKFRQLIVSMWPYISQQATNLTAEYLKLESVSRIPGRPDTLPTVSAEERNRNDYENATKNLNASNSVSEIVSAIGRALGQQDFETSRRLTELLPQGQLRSEYTEKVNWREAVSLLGKKDFDGAAKLASKLTEASSISDVYPQLIRNCVDKKDTGCVNSFTSELTKKLEKVDPMKAVLILSGIAATIASKDEPMALELLASAASVANTNGVKRAKHEEHVVGFECKAFELLTPTNEARVRQMADILIDRFQRQMAFAAIYRAKANALSKLEKKLAPLESKAK
ncbi:MAG: hypothetical protein SF097_23965 [Acidobacteriota bacterium]|nr:hypothetical protein [Acidobacteriota bacterium]